MTTISINPQKDASFEFDVSVQGVSKDDAPIVRFVIEDVYSGCNASLNCKKVRGSKWGVEIPKELNLSKDEYKFRLEVVVNEYYFEPASGSLAVVQTPDVQFEESVKPVVAAAFFTEESPTADAVLTEDENVDDVGNEAETVEAETDADVEESVEQAPIITVVPDSPIETPKKKKSLFNRDGNGKPVIRGIDPLEVIIDRRRKDDMVKEILKTTKS